MRFLVVALLILSNTPVSASGELQKISLAEAASKAVDQSKLTLPGSTPFHLKVTIAETTNPDSEYKAEVEEYWLSNEKWRRTIRSPHLAQTLIVNGDKAFERNEGDYYPWWLTDLVTAVFDPLPMLQQLRQINTQIMKPSGSENSSSCSRLQSQEGYLVFCFKSARGLLGSVVTPGYAAEFKDYQTFKDKQVARRIISFPEPGTTIEAKIIELTELESASEDLFAIQQPTDPQKRLSSIRVSEETARKLLLNAPDIVWPSVGKNPISGRMALYVSVDKEGHVREVWPKGSDNSDLEDPARDQVRKWQFKPAAANGVPVQMETVLTFTFRTKLEDSKKKP
jgi:TonB family protein